MKRILIPPFPGSNPGAPATNSSTSFAPSGLFECRAAENYLSFLPRREGVVTCAGGTTISVRPDDALKHCVCGAGLTPVQASVGFVTCLLSGRRAGCPIDFPQCGKACFLTR